jgi:glutathione synthase/RimK-type ligase-like ATP-grasp enzyme
MLHNKISVNIDEIHGKTNTDLFIKFINNKKTIVIFGLHAEGISDKDIELFTYYSKNLDNVYAIYNDIKHMDLIHDKYKTYESIPNNSNLLIPNYKQLKSIDDIGDEQSYPVIICSNKSNGGENMFVCDNYNEFCSAFNELNNKMSIGHSHDIHYYDKIILREFIESKYKNYTLNVRFFLLGNDILEVRSRPSNNRIVHTRGQITDENELIACRQYLHDWYNNNKEYANSCVSEIINIIGKGFWAIDLLLKDEKLYLCEFEYKYWDKSYSRYCKRHNLTFKDEDFKNHINKMNQHFNNGGLCENCMNDPLLRKEPQNNEHDLDLKYGIQKYGNIISIDTFINKLSKNNNCTCKWC